MATATAPRRVRRGRSTTITPTAPLDAVAALVVQRLRTMPLPTLCGELLNEDASQHYAPASLEAWIEHHARPEDLARRAECQQQIDDVAIANELSIAWHGIAAAQYEAAFALGLAVGQRLAGGAPCTS